MKKIQLGTSDQKAAAVILGCMRSTMRKIQ